MDNEGVAGILETVGQILEIQGENPFKVRAYSNAARQVRALPHPVKQYVDAGTLGEIPGIGEALQAKITEMVRTERLKYFDELSSAIPAGVLGMLRISGIGPKSVRVLWQEMQLTSIEQLRKACLEGVIARRKGFGDRSQQKILEGIDFLLRHKDRFLLSEAMKVARNMMRYLDECGHILCFNIAGSTRRGKELIRDVDIVAASNKHEQVMEWFVKADGVSEVLQRGRTKTSLRISSGLQVDLRVVSKKEYPFALQYFTGSKDHNVLIRSRAQKMGLKINEYGIFKGPRMLPANTEHEIYKTLKLDYIEPELREASGEIEAAEKGNLPSLVALKDLRGVFHNHSTWSDGAAKVEEMAEKARSMGLEYLGISDHSKSAVYANGLSEARLKKQGQAVDRLNKKRPDFRILKGTECDILADGSMDYSEAVLAGLDFVVGSIHSHFEMNETEMTSRISKALEYSKMHILAHPTGRLLLDREGYRVNLDEVIDAAARAGRVIELNASPHRLDLDWVHAREAGRRGVMLSINPDAHSTKGIEDIEFGVMTARRAWLTKEQILNTRSASEALKLLKGRKRK